MEGRLLPVVVVCYLRMANYKSFITTTTQVPTRLPFTLRVIFHSSNELSQPENAQTRLQATSGLRLDIHIRRLLGHLTLKVPLGTVESQASQ